MTTSLIETARALVKPGAFYTPSERAIILEAADHIAASGRVPDEADRPVLTVADGLTLIPPTPEPDVAVPKALADRIAVLEPKVAAKVARDGRNLEALVAARNAVTRARTEDEAQRATAEVIRAETNYQRGAEPDADTVELARLKRQVEAFKVAEVTRRHAIQIR